MKMTKKLAAQKLSAFEQGVAKGFTEGRKPMHWLAIAKNSNRVPKTWQEFESRKSAVDYLINLFELKPKQKDRLQTSLVTKVPYYGVIEVVCCECPDGKHEGEI
jgi:hypothetical protein